MSETSTTNPRVLIEMANGGKIRAELYPEIAPETVANFTALVSEGFFDGIIFHRVIPGFMIQGGDPLGSGTGGSRNCIKGEFASNGFKNDLVHDRGILSMARTADPNSASSQFFIMVAPAPHLDGGYAAFGRVLEGMEEVDKIVNTKADFRDKPINEQKMTKVVLE